MGHNANIDLDKTLKAEKSLNLKCVFNDNLFVYFLCQATPMLLCNYTLPVMDKMDARIIKFEWHINSIFILEELT